MTANPPFRARRVHPPRPDLQHLLQPNSRHCFVCGLNNPYGLQACFYQTGEKEVTVWYSIPAHFQGYPGVAHGGIVASLLDEVVGRSVMGTDPDQARLLFTARLSVRYRQHVPVETPLRLVGRALKDRGRTVTAWGGVYLAADDPETAQPLAEAESLLVAVADDVLAQMDSEALGWKVYPDCISEE